MLLDHNPTILIQRSFIVKFYTASTSRHVRETLTFTHNYSNVAAPLKAPLIRTLTGSPSRSQGPPEELGEISGEGCLRRVRVLRYCNKSYL